MERLVVVLRIALAPAFMAGLLGACVITQDFPSPADGAGRDDAPTAAGGLSPPCRTNDDPDNCGVCGHSRQGGACVAGACQPVQLATASTALGLAIDHDWVYWSSDTEILRVRIDGGAPERIAKLPGTVLSRRLILKGGFLYAGYGEGTRTTIARVASSGGSLTTVASTSPLACSPGAFEVAGPNLYFTCPDREGIYACPVTGCAGAPAKVDARVAALPLSAATPTSMTITKDALLALDYPPSGGGTPSLRRVPFDGTTACTLALDPISPPGSANSPSSSWALASDGKEALVTSGEALWRVAPACAEPSRPSPVSARSSPVARARLDLPTRFVVNDSAVLWGLMYLYDGSIVRCEKEGCDTPEVLASGQGYVVDVAATNDAVYWISAARIGSSPVPGTVMKLALRRPETEGPGNGR